ncbi:MAG: aminopeptidase P family protein [Methanobacteriota archaeon]|nr:MAG: aminopeptidase P family protein [Euryarchaeota archaeon]
MDELDQAIRGSNAAAYVVYASSADASMRYLSHFVTTDPVLFVKRPGERGQIVVSQMEIERAARESVAVPITRADARYLEFLKEEGNPTRALARTIAHLASGDVLVPSSFPLGLARELESFCRVSVDADTVEALRAVKQAGEIAAITQVQRAAESAIDRAIRMIRASKARDGVLQYEGEPLTSERVRFAMHVDLLSHGCRADDTIVSCGPDSALPHLAGSGPLLENEPIVIDLFPRAESSGYYADMTRTVVKGEPDPRILEMHQAVHEAKMQSMARIRAGVPGPDVYQFVVDLFKERGYTSDGEGFMHNLGHGIGLEVHERPTMGPAGKALVAGNVVTVEPGLYYRGIGGIRIEDLGVVTGGGFDLVTRYPEDLVV